MGQTVGDSLLLPKMNANGFAGAPEVGSDQFNSALNKTQMNEQIPTQDSKLPDTLTPPPITDAPQRPSITQGAPPATKAHKLLTILQSGLQGALAGRAASEQAVAQSGGHRSTGFGTGFETGYTLPWQRQQQQLGLQQQQANLNLTRAQSDMVPTQYGPMPAALARYILPAQIRGEATENAAQTSAGARVQGAQIGAGSRVQGAQIGADARIKAAQMGLGPLAQVPQELQDQFGLPAQLPLKMLNQAESAANKPLTVVPGENDSFVVNKQTQAKTPLGVGNRGAGAAMARPVQVAADPNNPGNLSYTTAGNAIKTGAAAPGSAATTTAKATARAVAPGGKVGEELNAFSTAIEHAKLLKQVATALKNGDVKALNGLKNQWSSAFGSSNLNDFNVVAGAYSREITKMLTAGHITDSEISSSGATLPSNANADTLLSAADKYQQLAQSKMNVRKQGVEKGMQGKANFPDAPQIQEGSTATGPNGHKIKFTQGKWVDAASGQPIQ